jgi:putative transposase
VAKKQLGEAEAHVSLSTIQRRVQDFDAYDRVRARYGPQYARAMFRTTVEGNRASRVLERLECDHTLLDFVVVCDQTWLPLGRPTLTLLVDSFTGYIVGLYVSFYGPGLTSAINVIKNGIMPKDEWVQAASLTQPWLGYGIPEMFVFDNGLEFHSRQLRLVAWELGVDIKYCRTRMPWVKPRVERCFADLNYLTLTKGRVFKPQPNTVRRDPSQEKCITFSAFVIGLLKFIVEVHPFELNSRRLERPFDLFKEASILLPPPSFPMDLERLNMIAAMSKMLRVAHHGVEFFGLNYAGVGIRDLRRRVGEKFKALVKWNPDDLSFVYVKDPTSDAWVIAPSMMPEYTTGLSWAQHLRIREFKRAYGIVGEDALIQSRLGLNDHWRNEMKKAKTPRLAQQQAAKFQGISSNQALLPSLIPNNAGIWVPREEMAVEEKEVVPFESFVM